MTGRRPLGSGVGWRHWRRQVRDESSIALAVAVTTLVSVAVVSAAPRVLEHASVADVRDSLESVTPEERNIQFRLDGRVGAGSRAEPFESLDLRGDELLDDEIPESVADLVAERQWVYDSPTFTVRSFPERLDGPFPTTFRFRYQRDVDEQVTVVRGRLPERAQRAAMLTGPDCPDDGTSPDDFELVADQHCEVVRLPVFETAITQQTATDMMVDLGDDVTLTPTQTDIAWRTAPATALGTALVLRISGIVELTEPTGDYWFSDSSLHRPRITENADYRLVGAVGLVVPEQYRQLLQAVPLVDHRYTWRYIVDPDLVTAADAGRLATDVERINPQGYTTITLLPDVLAEHVAQRRLIVQLLSTSTAGMFAVAIATIVVLTLLAAIRQRASTGLLIDRGASRWQLRVNAARTATLIVVAPAVVGAVLAWRCLPATASGASVRAAAAFAAGGFLTVVATSVPTSRDRNADRFRRIVVEASMLVAAVGSVLLLRRRGSVDTRVDAGFDLLLIVTPALVALAAGSVAVRVVGPVARAGVALGRRRRTLGLFVGFRRLVVQPPSARAPVAGMTIGVATAVLASVLAASVDAGQRAASWQLVGGDYRVETLVDEPPLPLGLDAASFGGRTAVFGARLASRRVEAGDRALYADVVGIDTVAYRSLLEGSGLTDIGLDELNGPSLDADRLRVIAVGRWPARGGLAVADQAVVRVSEFAPVIQVVAVLDRFPGLLPGRASLVADLGALRTATNERIAQPSFALLDGEPGDRAEIARVLDDRGALAVLTSRHDRLESIAGDPFSTWTVRSLRAAMTISLVFIVVVAVSAAAIASATRRRDLALLRVLGLRPGGVRLIEAIEHVPSMVASIVVGVVVGVVTAVCLEPVIGLSAFAGDGADVAVEIDGMALAVLIGVAAVAGALGIAVTHRVVGRVGDARMLGAGEQ